MNSHEIRLLIVTPTECYRDALMSADLNLTAEIAHVIESMTLWSFQLQEVGTLGYVSQQPYSQMLGAGFRVIGSGCSHLSDDSATVVRLIADFCPTHLVLQVPDRTVFSWAARNQIPTLALFTESEFAAALQRRDAGRLISALSQPAVSYVGAQGRKFAKALEQAGISPQKIIPWNWPHNLDIGIEPNALRQLDLASRPLQLLYKGPLISAKGVGDLIIAIAQLRARGIQARLTLIGQGELDRFRQQALQLQLEDRIDFCETIAEPELAQLLEQSDILVMPTRHEYPEADLSLVAQGLYAHIPIVASDHSAFVSKLLHGTNALIFPAGNARALAHRIERLVSQPQLYEQLSEPLQTAEIDESATASWFDLIEHWLMLDDSETSWLADHCLMADQPLSSASAAR
ncbi:MAG: glycosyltransferase [Leptolyngbya sp. SIO4C1]|nr:glycosyltransferase [Leptolyngbya sp. SIO4C1]